jgi:hypothetical protein
MARVIITVPDHARVADVADYVETVADQIDNGYLSGHVDAETHWTSEGVG